MKLIKNIALIGLILLSSNLFSQTYTLPDSGFKACLIEKYGSLLDANHDLIISEAEAHTGFLSCIGAGIKNIDGFQYFTNVKDVNFSRNSISTITEWPTNDSITRLVLDDNVITSVASFENLTKLKTLTIRRNSLTSVPDLSSNKSLVQLYLQGNLLTSLPNTDSLTGLWVLNISDNQLTSLPSLDHLTLLTELSVSGNQLTNMPSLKNLINLTSLRISNNKLVELPLVPNTNKITELRMESNNFSEMPDFSLFPKASRVYLNDNYFTFSDLEKLESIVGFDTIFVVSSQRNSLTDKKYSVKENEGLELYTDMDEGVFGVQYSWFYNGVEVPGGASSTQKAFTDSVSFSGTYYCQLSKPEFPNLKLKTAHFIVTILPCFDQSSFDITVTNRNCEVNEGSIVVVNETALPEGFTYELISITSGQTQTSIDGVFSHLGEVIYQLNGFVGTCRKTIKSDIEIGEEDCLNVHISADGDSVNDTYYFNEEGKVIIRDKFGNVVSELLIPASWNGNGKSGKVAPGLYYADINQGEKLVKITVVY